ncbi:hypothetical protein ONS95_007147 [Cadophora gregata]|uniref:uncharacterized protein n=1 Tax=Cadophora gregata TaxID=51156 RepID=UPI0026DD65C3|nr:uncharacterized protein ONS95_007147 [Cadophora gregata]KAK0100695.1 hypothetical protein ONS95_007147 [Cadophora gregata]KAK0117308.1 hypothetical protein ONS96_013140 [Cadophora gregata f. sp. sojae]
MATSQGALPPPPGIVADLRHPRDVLKTVNFVVQGLCLAFATGFVALRMYTGLVIQKSIFKEDWVCLAAWMMFSGYLADNIVLGFFGGGNNVWEVSRSELEDFLKVNYGGLLLYGLTACLIKLTLLLFTARLSKTAHKSTRVINFFIFVILGFYIPMQFAKTFICTPIPAYWNRVPYPNSTCLDMRAITISDTVMSTVTDLAVLLVPVPLVWGMKIPLRKKFRAIGMLAAGGLAVVASITRLVFVRHIWETHNGTLYNAAFNMFGAAETSVGLICACLPSMSLFLAHHRRGGSEAASSSTPVVELGVAESMPFKT